MMELGSIHPDEQSARRAVAMLLGAGIEADRVKVIRPRAARSDGAKPEATGGWGAWKGRLRDAAAGATYGGALAALVCVALTVLDAALIAAAPVLAYVCIVGTSVIAGALSSLGASRKAAEPAPRARRSTRGWAVVVHARDADQRALAARALARARSAAA
jgi:hypothetical protein